ncbi:MAG: 50S ribosomal protein L3 [Luteitalea sp.]|nr:50S ribosomal protein L3 [Luteitalea sp.]
MVTGIIGKKVGMTQIFDATGAAVPVTVIKAGPCVVVQRKTATVDGYDAVQLGLVEGKPAKVNRPLGGHFKKANVPPARLVREVAAEGDDVVAGTEVVASMFQDGELVDVTGTSRGHGFQGVMKRHGFAGGAASHGSMFHRAPGSIGASSFPSRVLKGMRAPGRMGADRVTVHNLKVVRVDAEKHLLLVRGAVPGARNGYVLIRKAVKPKRVAEPQAEKPKGKR